MKRGTEKGKGIFNSVISQPVTSCMSAGEYSLQEASKVGNLDARLGIRVMGSIRREPSPNKYF